MRTLIASLAIIAVLLVSCGPTAAPQPQATVPETAPPSAPPAIATPAAVTPQPEPVKAIDTPKISPEEAAALIWNQVPAIPAQGFKKSQLQADTGKAIYKEQGKWGYTVSGEVRETSLLPIRYFERSPDDWVEDHSNEVRSYKVVLTAEFFENTNTLKILNVEKTGETTTVEIINQSPIVARKLKVAWIQGSTTGYALRIEGSVENIGVVPVENVIFQVATFTNEGKLIRTDNVTLSPARLNVGESSKFFLEAKGVDLTGKPDASGKVTYGKYAYRFLLPNGKEIPYERPK